MPEQRKPYSGSYIFEHLVGLFITGENSADSQEVMRFYAFHQQLQSVGNKQRISVDSVKRRRKESQCHKTWYSNILTYFASECDFSEMQAKSIMSILHMASLITTAK